MKILVIAVWIVASGPWTHGSIYSTGDQASLSRLSNHGTSGDTDE